MEKSTLNYGALVTIIMGKLPEDTTLTVAVHPNKRGAFIMNGRRRVLEGYYLARKNVFTLVMPTELFEKVKLPESVEHIHHEGWGMPEELVITDENFKDFTKSLAAGLAKAIVKVMKEAEKAAAEKATPTEA